MLKIALLLLTIFSAEISAAKTTPVNKRQSVLNAARHILDNYDVSYVYGGNSLGSLAECQLCKSCLDSKKPPKNQWFDQCPACQNCSLDCSHFTNQVFQNAGLKATYLPTQQMLELSAADLRAKYHFIDMGHELANAQAGDLLVYTGHVVLLERNLGQGFGDIIHATSGRDLRGAGQGVQRLRRASLNTLRGPVMRILRHISLVTTPKPQFRPVTSRLQDFPNN